MKSKLSKRNTGVIRTAAIVMVVASAMLLPVTTQAAPPAPNWLPGQPLLAGNQVVAMWLPVPGAVKYIIYLDGKKLAELPANQYISPAPQKGGEYKYQVSAVDASGAESPMSREGIIRIILITPPTEIMVRPTPAAKSANFRWKAPAGAAFVNIYEGESKAGPYKFIESVQGDSYVRTNLEYDRKYYFSFSSKDVTGKESTQSDPIEVVLEKPKEAAKAIKIDMVVKRTKELDKLRVVGGLPAGEVMRSHSLSDGTIWISGFRDPKLVELDNNNNPRLTIDIPKALKEAGSPLKFVFGTNFFMNEDNEQIVTMDGINNTVVSFDFKGRLLWATQMVHPPKSGEWDHVWSLLSEGHADKNPRPVSGVFVDDDTIWLSDGGGPVVYVVDAENGDILSYWSGYEDEDGETLQSGGILAFIKADETTMWAAEPMMRYGVAFDIETKKVKYMIGVEKDGFKGGFDSLNHFVRVPFDNNILIVDAGISTLQVFDPATGKYLYHYGGEVGDPDPKLDGQRPNIEYGGFNAVAFDAQDHLRFTDVVQKVYSIRQVLDE